MFGLFAFPLNLLAIIPPIKDHADCIFHDGHGFSNPPPFACHAFVLVTSSSGFLEAMEGTAMVAAYSRADVELVDMIRFGWEGGGGGGGK